MAGEHTGDRHLETATCKVCGFTLHFDTGEFGQSIEKCSNGACLLSRPHRIIPDLSLLKGPDTTQRIAARRDAKREAEGREKRPRGNPNLRKND